MARCDAQGAEEPVRQVGVRRPARLPPLAGGITAQPVLKPYPQDPPDVETTGPKPLTSYVAYSSQDRLASPRNALSGPTSRAKRRDLLIISATSTSLKPSSRANTASNKSRRSSSARGI